MTACSSAKPTLEQQIATYLVQHPHFFEQHPDALMALNLKHDSGSATSLLERQLRQFRQQNQEYRTQLAEFLQVARTNEALDQRLHQMILALLNTTHLADTLGTLQHQIQSVLTADAVAFKLFATPDLHTHKEQPETLRLLHFLQQQQPTCGALSKAQAHYLFATATMHSVVLIPLQSAVVTGILAIGSQDATRFHAEQSVALLHRLAQVVNAILNSKIVE